MDKNLVGLMAAIGALTPLSAAQAEVSSAELDRAMDARSFAQLLQPIPNARAVLAVADQQQAVSPDAGVQMADYHHHHHHHHRRHYHHHHHHYY